MKDTAHAIRVSPGEEGRLIVVLPYTPERVARIKTVDGRRWDGALKHWTVPAAEDMPARLRALFAGEPLEFEATARPAAPSNSGPLVERLRLAIRARHFSRSTEKTYAAWTERFLKRQGAASPETLGEDEVGRFLSELASVGHVSASTQNQALNSLLFFFQEVLGRKLGLIEGVVRAKRPQRLPVVLSRDEVRAVVGLMSGPPRLMATLLYGCGLRLLECCRLRVKDLDFAQNQIVVRAGKGNKDRYTMLPAGVQEPLKLHLEAVRLSIRRIWLRASGAWNCRTRWTANIRTLRRNGAGNGRFPRLRTTSIARPASAVGIISMNPSCRRRSERRSLARASPNPPAVIRFGTRSRPIFWRTGMTSARSKSF